MRVMLDTLLAIRTDTLVLTGMAGAAFVLWIGRR